MQQRKAAAATTSVSSQKGSPGVIAKLPTPTPATLQLIEETLKQVYGDWTVLRPQFWPQPLPACEAGLGLGRPGFPAQRRQLWVDSFGLLSFCTLAKRTSTSEDGNRGAFYVELADKLVRAVHRCLGEPRLREGRYGWREDLGASGDELEVDGGGRQDLLWDEETSSQSTRCIFQNSHP